MKILIGSCGGLTGFYLSKEFKKNYPKSYIVGMDSFNPYATIKMIDEFVACPCFKDEKIFIDFILSFLEKNNIEYYFPTHSKETILISKYEKEIRKRTSTRFIVSPYETYMAFNSKIDANRSLTKCFVNVPKLYNGDEMIYPAFVKPMVGSGSNDASIILDEMDYNYYKKRNRNNAFFEYVDGQEYTVDAVFDNEGKLITYNQRVRIKQLSGATIYTKNDFSQYDSYDDLMKMSKKYAFKGVVNFQFILKNSIAYYTDINLRYASGGLPLSVESGLNIAKMLIDILDDKSIDKSKYQSDRKNCSMMRYFEEMYKVE